jgi:hypothetical protein
VRLSSVNIGSQPEKPPITANMNRTKQGIKRMRLQALTGFILCPDISLLCSKMLQ